MSALVELYKTDHAALLTFIKQTYGIGLGTGNASNQALNPHRLRREAIAQRIRLYRDDGRTDFERLIETVFETVDAQKQRQKMIQVASEQNVTRRIVDEIASLYDRPAVRKLASAADKFRAEASDVELDEVMQEAHRLTFLCNEVLVWRTQPLEDGAPNKLHVVTPDVFDAVPDPRDRLEAAGFLLDMCPVTTLTGADRAALPHYELWDDTYRYLISADGNLVDGDGKMVPEPIKHGLDRIPGVLFHRRKPVDRLLDCRHGTDIVSAHLAVGLLNVMIMRLAKSQGERQPILQGNLANVAIGQSADGERPLVLPPEVVASMLEMKTDPEHYISAKKDKIASVAQTYGMSYELLSNQETSDSSSGRAFQARRLKLNELRNEQRRRAVLHERLTIALMGYSVAGLRIDYAEQATPQDDKDELELLDAKTRLGLDNPVAYLQRKDPDLDEEAAWALLKTNLKIYGTCIELYRSLNAPANADAANPGQDPVINGALGSPKTALATLDAANNPASGATTRNQSTGKSNATAAQAGAAR